MIKVRGSVGLGVVVVLTACNSGVDCDSTEMRSATYQYVQGMESACGRVLEQGVGSQCVEDMKKGMKDIWSDEQLACIDSNIERIKSRELPMP